MLRAYGGNEMNFEGILIGLGSFLIIGLLHPVVIKVEYHIGKQIWPLFLIVGIISNVGSLLITQPTVSILCAVFGFSLFWSIRELYEQEKRVEKGWFPRNPLKETKKQQGGIS